MVRKAAASNMNQDELMHYGVIGMRWGVRRGNVEQAYEKASKKLTKLNTKILKKTNKANRAMDKSDRMSSSWIASERSKAKYEAKARKAQTRVDRAVRKAQKWLNSMDKTFSKTTVSLSKEQQAMGQNYMNYIDTRRIVKYS